MKLSRFVLIALSVLFAGSLLSAGIASAADSVAIVDLKKAISESASGKAAETKLKSIADKMQEEFKPKQERVKRLREELETQRFVLSKEARQERELDIVKQSRDLERELEAAQEDLQIEERKLTQPILENILSSVKALARDEGIDLVLERSNPALIYYGEALDITDKVIERVNKG